MKTKELLVSVGIAAALGISCSTPAESEQGKTESGSQGGALGTPEGGELEEVFAAIAQEMPEFAGFYRDESNHLVVRVTDDSRADAVRAVVRKRTSDGVAAKLSGAAAEGGEGAPAMDVRLAQFSFAQLAKWREMMLPALRNDKVVLVGLEEKRNRVVLRVKDSSVRDWIMDLAKSASIPPTAILVEDEKSPALTSHARQYRRGRGTQSKEAHEIKLPGERATDHL